MEQAMSTMNLGVVTFRPFATSRWNQVKHLIGEWRRRARSRHELMSLGEAGLHDIGLSRCDAARELSKPFWQV
jgi:uncharacterized protein YjiS (DUF1127 family)